MKISGPVFGWIWIWIMNQMQKAAENSSGFPVFSSHPFLETNEWVSPGNQTWRAGIKAMKIPYKISIIKEALDGNINIINYK